MVLRSISCCAWSAATSAFAGAILLKMLLSFVSSLAVSFPAGMLPLSAVVSCCAVATTCDSEKKIWIGDVLVLEMNLVADSDFSSSCDIC